MLLRQLDSHAAQEIVIGMVANQGQHEIILQADRSARRDDHDVVNADLLHRAVEVGFDISLFLMRFSRVRLDPVLDVVVQLRLAIDQRDARAVTPQIESGNRGRVLAADHQHVGVVIRMRLGVIVRDLGQILAGHVPSWLARS